MNTDLESGSYLADTKSQFVVRHDALRSQTGAIFRRLASERLGFTSKAHGENVVNMLADYRRGRQRRNPKAQWAFWVLYAGELRPVHNQQTGVTNQEVANDKLLVVRGDPKVDITLDPPDERASIEIELRSALFADAHFISVADNGRFLRHRPKRSERCLNYGRFYHQREA